MKFCPQCGTQLRDEDQFCSECGSRMAPAPAAPAYQASASTPPAAPAPTCNAAPAYAAPAYTAPTAPAATLKTNRTLLKLILLSLITFGIYGLVVMTQLTNDVNTIVSPHDGKKSMHYCLLCFLISPITLGIAGIVWTHKIANRIGGELTRRGIDYKFGAGTYWGWGVLGSLIVVGPFIYCHKLLKSVNLLAENYNTCGW